MRRGRPSASAQKHLSFNNTIDNACDIDTIHLMYDVLWKEPNSKFSQVHLDKTRFKLNLKRRGSNVDRGGGCVSQGISQTYCPLQMCIKQYTPFYRFFHKAVKNDGNAVVWRYGSIYGVDAWCASGRSHLHLIKYPAVAMDIPVLHERTTEP